MNGASRSARSRLRTSTRGFSAGQVHLVDDNSRRQNHIARPTPSLAATPISLHVVSYSEVACPSTSRCHRGCVRLSPPPTKYEYS